MKTVEHWSRFPLRRQLTLAVNGLLLLFVVLFLVVGHSLRIREAKREKRIALSEEAKTVYESVDAIADGGPESIQRLIDDVCARMNASESPGHHIAVEWQDHSIETSFHGRVSGEMYRAMEADDAGFEHLERLSRLTVVGRFTGPEGTVRVSESGESVFRNARQELFRQIVAVLVAGVLAALMVHLLLNHVVTRPLQRLVAALGLIGDGDLNVVAGEYSCEELDCLSTQINQMTMKLAAADQDRRLHMKKARSIQQHLRPTNGNILGIETTELFEPADDVGGDYYDVIPLGSGRCLLCLADVSGHGVPAAMAAAVIKALVLEAVDMTDSPAEILSRINRRYSKIIIPGHFATMVVVVLDSKARTLSYANAGHEPPFVQEPGKPVARLRIGDLMLGIDESVTYTEQTVSIPSGTTIILVSDGVTETEDLDDNLFGADRVSKAMEAVDHTTVRDLVADLCRELVKFRSGRRQRDDMTVLAAQLTQGLAVEKSPS